MGLYEMEVGNVELVDLCVPIGACICVGLGPVERKAVLMLQEQGYDQAPVLGADPKSPIGLVKTSHLDALLRSGGPLSAEDPEIDRGDARFGVDHTEIPLEVLLERFTRVRALLVFTPAQHSEPSPGPSDWFLGLLTLSDLNRQAFRGRLYSMMSEVEVGLASIVSRVFLDSWDWIRHLNEENQVRILGYWELARRKGVDVGPIAATTLTQLLQVAGRAAKVLSVLGYSPADFTALSGPIPEVRNRVMHPVRPLVLGPEDVGIVLKAVRALHDLGDRIAKINQAPA